MAELQKRAQVVARETEGPRLVGKGMIPGLVSRLENLPADFHLLGVRLGIAIRGLDCSEIAQMEMMSTELEWRPGSFLSCPLEHK
jgi:hypothetical protein